MPLKGAYSADALAQRCAKAEIEIDRLRDILRDVRAEIDLRKSPKLLERIEAALTAAKG